MYEIAHAKFPVEGEGSLFPVMRTHGSDGKPLGYGYFGYAGSMCDLGIRQNNPEMVNEAFQRGWMDHDTRTLDGLGMVKYARKYGSEKAAQALIKLGFADEVWPHPPVTQ